MKSERLSSQDGWMFGATSASVEVNANDESEMDEQEEKGRRFSKSMDKKM